MTVAEAVAVTSAHEVPFRVTDVGAAGLSYVQPFGSPGGISVPLTTTLTFDGSIVPASLTSSLNVHERETTLPRIALIAASNAVSVAVAEPVGSTLK